ncbi:hypothetical protein ACFU8I_04080 [Streptomyces sp. NPDC057540]|uniref:hypothetical protein n=1 Tax=Streptomyces sp. NPDC057540 TaxID=3346160 RepID=UPI003690DDDF
MSGTAAVSEPDSTVPGSAPDQAVPAQSVPARSVPDPAAPGGDAAEAWEQKAQKVQKAQKARKRASDEAPPWLIALMVLYFGWKTLSDDSAVWMRILAALLLIAGVAELVRVVARWRRARR